MEHFKAVWSEVREECELDTLARSVAALEYSGIKHKVRRAELIFYLKSVHNHALKAIQSVLVNRGLLEAGPRFVPDSSKQTLLTNSRYFDQMKQVREVEDISAETWFLAVENFSQSLMLRYRFPQEEVGRRNWKFLTADFPSIYVDQLRKLLSPEWYTACFVKAYNNSSMWANYGDGHRGSCLIFEVEEEHEQPRIKLNQVTGGSFSQGTGYQEHWGFAPMTFHAVCYQAKPDEVDFFRFMGQPSRDALLTLWYTDESGRLLDCATQAFESDGNVNAWRKTYWDNFFRDTCFKTKDWEYEQELRLILYSPLGDSLYHPERTLTYDFNSLKGIIFGMRMSDDEKLETIDILTRKCRESQRTDFKFLQAFYSPETGDIRSYEIPMDSPLENSQDGAY